MEKLVSVAPLAIGAAVVAVLGYQGYVTSLVWRSEDLSVSQKWLHTGAGDTTGAPPTVD